MSLVKTINTYSTYIVNVFQNQRIKDTKTTSLNHTRTLLSPSLSLTTQRHTRVPPQSSQVLLGKHPFYCTLFATFFTLVFTLSLCLIVLAKQPSPPKTAAQNDQKRTKSGKNRPPACTCLAPSLSTYCFSLVSQVVFHFFLSCSSFLVPYPRPPTPPNAHTGGARFLCGARCGGIPSSIELGSIRTTFFFRFLVPLFIFVTKGLGKRTTGGLGQAHQRKRQERTRKEKDARGPQVTQHTP